MMHIDSPQNPNVDFIQKRLNELNILAEINKEIHSTVRVERLLQILVEKAVIGVNFERGLVYLLQDDYLRCVAFLDRSKKERASIIRKIVGFRMDETAAEVLAVKMGKPVYIRDALTDKRVSEKFLKVTDAREYCAVPLIGREKPLGVLTGDKFYSKNKILPEDIETLQLFAEHISLAIDNAQLYEEKESFSQILEKTVEERTSELAKKNQELTILYEMSQLLNNSLSVTSISAHLLTMIQKVGFEIGSIFLVEKRESSLVSSIGFTEDYRNLEESLIDDIIGNLRNSENAYLICGLDSLSGSNAFRKFCSERGIGHLLLIPLIFKDDVIMFMVICASKDDDRGEDQKRFFTAFARQAELALRNAFTFRQVMNQKNHIESISKKLEQENTYLKARIRSDLSNNFVIGKSQAMLNVMRLIYKVAPTDTTVTIYGETGTGKEVLAKAIHEMSPRKNHPLITVNCAAIPEDLIESELFGHEKGAYTGAHDKRVGLFELAEGGTIFMDEIGEISLKTQAKLLRVLQQQEIRRLGAKEPIQVNVRVLAATNRDLRAAVENGSFRADLFYRINVLPIYLPPLRERIQDIEQFVQFFIRKHNRNKKLEIRFDEEVLETFASYSWPGNIRELENVIERLLITSGNGTVRRKDLPKEMLSQSSLDITIKPLREAMTEFKKNIVLNALAKSGGKKSLAAEFLGLPRSNFSRLLKQLGI